MPLFQKTILAKYLQAQDKAQTAEKWNIYKRHFLNPQVQANIIDIGGVEVELNCGHGHRGTDL